MAKTGGEVMDFSGLAIRASEFQDSNGVVILDTITSTDNAVARFNGTAGVLQNTGIIIADTTNAVSGLGPLTQTGAGANVFNSTALDTDFTVKAITSGNAISYDAGTSAITLASTTIGATGAVTITGAVSQSGSTTYTTATAGTILKQGANGRVGTFVANGITPVSVANSSITANSVIIFTLKTVGGAVGAYPAIQTITASTGFTVAATASDTSTYNYAIIESAA